jgi:hypothetical protein
MAQKNTARLVLNLTTLILLMTLPEPANCDQIMIDDNNNVVDEPASPNAPTVSLANDISIQLHDLQDAVDKLNARAAKLAESEAQYNQHARNYLLENLHQGVVEPEQQSEHLSALHKEFSGHVANLKSLVEDYRTLVEYYTAHYWQYQRFVQKSRLKIKQANLGAEGIALQFATTKAIAALKASEKHTAIVFRNLSVVPAESRHSARSHLCPAFDDLTKQLVKAIDAMTTSIEGLPPERVSATASTKLIEIQELKTELKDAESLKDEQVSLDQKMGSLKQDLVFFSIKMQNLLLPPNQKTSPK